MHSCFNTLLILVIQLLKLTDEWLRRSWPRSTSKRNGGSHGTRMAKWGSTASSGELPVKTSYLSADWILSPALSTISQEKSSTLILPCDPLWIQPPPPLRQHISKKHKGLQGCVYKKYSSNKRNFVLQDLLLCQCHLLTAKNETRQLGKGDLSSLMDYLSFPKTITPETPNYISFCIFYFFKCFVNLWNKIFRIFFFKVGECSGFDFDFCFSQKLVFSVQRIGFLTLRRNKKFVISFEKVLQILKSSKFLSRVKT